MPTLEEVYAKFGYASEAAQLLETELGNFLIFKEIGLNSEILLKNKNRAKRLFDNINHKTLGKLLFDLGVDRNAPDGLGDLLFRALSARNRLFHSFFREHNFRRNSEDGRFVMAGDLDSIHEIIIDAYKAILLTNGFDLDAMSIKPTTSIGPSAEDPPYLHLPI